MGYARDALNPKDHGSKPENHHNSEIAFWKLDKQQSKTLFLNYGSLK
jgi:hypothetical protein